MQFSNPLTKTDFVTHGFLVDPDIESLVHLPSWAFNLLIDYILESHDRMLSWLTRTPSACKLPTKLQSDWFNLKTTSNRRIFIDDFSEIFEIGGML